MPCTRRDARSLACMTVLLAASASAQDLPGVGVDSYGNYYSCHDPAGRWNNPTSAWLAGEASKRMQNDLITSQWIGSMLLNEAITQEMRRQTGAKVIAEGRATTTFRSTPEGSTLPGRVPKGAGAEERARAIAGAQDSLDGFAKVLKQHRCAEGDVADSVALAFVMCYAALRDQDPGPRRLAALRERFRRAWLTDPVFQSRTDRERQAMHENAAILAMVAVTARAGANNGTLGTEQRRALAKTADEVATAFLKDHVEFTVAGLELTEDGFGDRGTRLAASGAGTTTFARTPAPLVVEPYARHWGFLVDQRVEAFREWLTRFDAIVTAGGGARDDYADGNAAAFAVLYPVITKDAVELSRRQVQWVRAEMRKDLLASASYQRMTDTEKQRLFETLALDAMRIRTVYLRDRAILARPVPAEPFAALADASAKRAAEEGLRHSIASATAKAEEIFAPRKLAEHVLVESGFAAKGTPGAITSQAPEDAPAAAGFATKGMPQKRPVRADATTRFRRASEPASPDARRSPPLVADFDAALRASGGRTDDLADARALAFVRCFALATNGKEPSAAQVAGTREFFRAQVLASNEVQDLDDAGRQRAYEELAVRTMELLSEAAKATPAPDSDDPLERMRRILEGDAKEHLRTRARTLLASLLAPTELDAVEMGEAGLRVR